MFKVILFLVLLFPFKSFGQFITQPMLNWDLIELKSSKEIKQKFINDLIGNEYFDVNYLKDTSNFISSTKAKEFIGEEFNNYHILNVNGDSIMDVIYEGSHSTSETDNIIIFINTGNGIEIALKIYGNIENFSFKDNKLSKMQTIIWPCCGNYITYRHYYSCDKIKYNMQHSQDSSYSLFQQEYFSNLFPVYLDSIEVLEYCERPDTLNQNKVFITNDFAYLTFKPETPTNEIISDEDYGTDISYLAEENNLIARIKPGSKGKILAEEIGLDGNKYFFIRTYNLNSDRSIFNNSNFIIYGWLQSEGIQIH
jgi:hypothetical protein